MVKEYYIIVLKVLSNEKIKKKFNLLLFPFIPFVNVGTFSPFF